MPKGIPRATHQRYLKQLQYLYARRASVVALIRSLEEYNEYRPRLVVKKEKSA